ncbi:MAG: hypothetical protein U1A78_25180 [Polyangia bacterium]
MSRWCLAACFLIAACGKPSPVLEPTETVAGRTSTEWSVSWWQWAYAQPTTNHPLLYEGAGDFCATGQPAADVFFLGPTFGGDAVRGCTVPANRTLVFPITVGEDSNYPMDNPQRTTAQLVQAAKENMDSVSSLHLELDGEPLIGGTVSDFARFRQTASFPVVVPNIADSIVRTYFMIDFAGTIPLAVSDGYWILMRPLPAGAHTLKFSAALSVPAPFQSGVEYRLTVK